MDFETETTVFRYSLQLIHNPLSFQVHFLIACFSLKCHATFRIIDYFNELVAVSDPEDYLQVHF
jgi:hypothetical protein